jgi:hypothetical protein
VYVYELNMATSKQSSRGVQDPQEHLYFHDHLHRTPMAIVANLFTMMPSMESGYLHVNATGLKISEDRFDLQLLKAYTVTSRRIYITLERLGFENVA